VTFNKENMLPFDDLWRAVTTWAEQESARIAMTGRPLTPSEVAIAKKVGARSTELIRVLVVTTMPFPEDVTLRAIGAQVGLTTEQSGGMTLGHGIFIRADQVGRKDIWPHEFRHVAQYECFGSIKTFMFFYLKELLHFRYGPGPLEVDAKKAEEV
jgi:hypothetical protein